jgi:hypothetical protein
MIKTLPRRAPSRAAESSRQVGEDMKDKEADPQPAELIKMASFHTLSDKIKVIT